MRRARRRALILALALAATLGATWWAAMLEDDELATDEIRPARDGRPEAAARSPRRRGAREMPSLQPLGERRAPWPDDAHAILRPTLPDPGEPAAGAPEPVAPGPPPLPFRFVGAMEEGGRRTAFLLDGRALRIVRAGDRIADYRVERITAEQIEFIYLPLRERQVLHTSGS